MQKIKRFAFLSIAILALLTITGCGVDYETDKDGKTITDENGARVVANPITDESSFKEVWSEDGWFSGLIVYPLVKIITFIGELFNSYGLAIILSTILVRLIALPLTIKSAKQQRIQQKLQPQVKKIQVKYANRKDRESQYRMNAEIQALYRENNVNVLGGCLGLLVTMPLFFGFYSAIYRTPGIFNENFLGFKLFTTPSNEITSGNFIYIIPIILVFAANYYSMKFSTSANKPAKSDVKRPYNAAEEKSPNMMQQQMKIMQIMMPIMMSFISLTLPTGIAVYFLSSSIFAVIQTLIVKKVS